MRRPAGTQGGPGGEPPAPVRPGVELLRPWLPFADPASVWLNSAGLPYAPDAAMPDTFFTDLAGRFLSQPHPKPFFLWVDFYVTHSLFRFPVEFRGMFDPGAFPVPGVTPGTAPRSPRSSAA